MSMRYAAGFISAFFNPLKNPNAPTIGTATLSGASSASVTFTAPSDIGGSAITSYTAVSSPGGFTGTAASSPVTVSGLSGGTAYTFKVFATNSYGPSALSAASNSVTTLPAIGGAYGGGFFAGQISTAANGVADFNLVVGPVASAQSSLQYKIVNTATTGTSSFINGPANSAAMNDVTHPAAQFCEGLTIGGFSDWYLPAKNELEVCYYNLKPTTTNNDTSSGTNTNAVPSRGSNYTSGNPAQTSATDFRSTGTEDFDAAYYWSSTQYDYTPGRAFLQQFGYGYQTTSTKNDARNVRAIRRVAV